LSEPKDLEKLQAKRAELEAESRSLKEEQKKLEYSVKILEEQVVIDELSENNKAAKDAISQLEAKLNDLEKRMKQSSQEPPPENPAPPPSKETKTEVQVAAAPEKKEEAPEPAEVKVEDSEDSGVTVTAIDDEALVETQEAQGDKQPEKKKHRFF
jgi:septal ring factor EnvC (AmiA/AmiB activator)